MTELTHFNALTNFSTLKIGCVYQEIFEYEEAFLKYSKFLYVALYLAMKNKSEQHSPVLQQQNELNLAYAWCHNNIATLMSRQDE